MAKKTPVQVKFWISKVISVRSSRRANTINKSINTRDTFTGLLQLKK